MIKQKKIKRWLIVVVLLVAVCAGIILHIFSLMMPSQAAERDALSNEDGGIVNIGGFDLWYKLLNADSLATPIIVVAGGGGLSSDYMEESLRFLSDTNPILFFDGRGCGRSQIKPELENYSISISADEIEQLRKHFFADREIIIISHSFGGIIAMDYAVNHTDKLEKLILISSMNANYKVTLSRTFFGAGFAPKDQLLANEWYMENVDVFFGPYFENIEAKRILENTRASYAVSVHTGMPNHDLSEEIQTVTCPVLLLVGGEKEYPSTHIEETQKLASLFPNSQLEQFSNSGHFLFAEEDDRFIQVVNVFLK